LFDNIGVKERLAYLTLAGALLALAGYAGAQYLRRPATVVFAPEQPPVAAKPAPESPTSSVAPAQVVVHVAGCVKRAGVYRLSPDSRVEDAVAKAGGAKADADLDRLNLAAKLEDGTQVYVPRKGADTDIVPDPEPNAAYATKPATAPKTSAQARGERPGPKPLPTPGSISLNTANLKELQKLPGVGPATAERILEYRKEHGRFTAVEELLAVNGIGPKKLEKMRKYLRL
jgi:competence protein ComEA